VTLRSRPVAPRPGRAADRLAALLAGLALAAAGLPAAPAAADMPPLVFGLSPAVFQQQDDAIATRLGFWMDASWVNTNRDPNSVDVNHVNVLVDSRWRYLQGFLEVEYEHGEGLDNSAKEDELEIEQAFVRFGPRDGISLRGGRFNTPMGIWFPSHWSILMDTIEEPPHAARQLLPEQQLGGELSGRLFPGWLSRWSGQLDYALFAGGGNDHLGQGMVEDFSVGGDVRVLLDERYLVGASAYHQKNGDWSGRHETDVMLYGEAHLPASLLFRAEFLHQQRERPDGKAWSRTLDVGYAKLRWDFARWFYLNYRVSYGDDDRPKTGETTRQLVNTFTLGFQPHRTVRVKLEYSLHDFASHRREDFRFLGASLGVCF